MCENRGQVTTKAHNTVDGYIVDVRLTDGATFEDAAVVVSLIDESGNVMQKNTLKEEHGLTTTSLTCSFDVKGTFVYVEGGFWVIEGSVKDNYNPPTKIVIEVILTNGKILRETLTEIIPVAGYVTNYEELAAALTNPKVDKIVLGEDIELTSLIVLDKNLDGKNKKLKVATGLGSTVPVIEVKEGVALKNVQIVTSDRTDYEVKVTGSNAVVENVTISRDANRGHAGIFVQADKVILSKNTLNSANIGVFLGAGQTVTITDNTITCQATDKIWVTGDAYGSLPSDVTLDISSNGAENVLVEKDNNFTHYYETEEAAMDAAEDGDIVNGKTINKANPDTED